MLTFSKPKTAAFNSKQLRANIIINIQHYTECSKNHLFSLLIG